MPPDTIDRTRPPAPGAVRLFDFPAAERNRLSNGLETVVSRHGNLPLVRLWLVVDAGAGAESAAAAGVATLTARALETGTEERDADEVAWELERLGAPVEVHTGWDASVVSVTVASERLEPAIRLFAELVQHPIFPVGEIERLRQEQLVEILQRQKEPSALAADAAARVIFAPETQYARPLVGTASSVGAIDREQVEAFYRANYVPERCALLLVGDVPHAALALAERHFGHWRGNSGPTLDFKVAERTSQTTIYIVDRPGAGQSELLLGHVGVERRHEDYFPILVMNTILGGAFTSRLNLNLRERHGFTYGAQSSFAFRRHAGPFLVQAAVATDVTARGVEEALREMRALHEEGASPEEVAAARDYLAGELPLALETTFQLAAHLADLVIYHLPDDYFHHYRDRVAAVSVEDVLRVAQQHLRLDRLAIIVVGDAASTREPLERLCVGPVEVHGIGW